MGGGCGAAIPLPLGNPFLPNPFLFSLADFINVYLIGNRTRACLDTSNNHLNIPKDHYMGIIIRFGYPEIEYARSVQKTRGTKIHRFSSN